MKASETAKLLAVISAAYPNFQADESRAKVWAQMLADVDYRVADIAVWRHIATSKFPPSIAEIREQARIALQGPEYTATESWEEFIQGIRRFGQYREQEALDSFHPLTRRMAEAIGWWDACMSENVDVLRGQYLRMFEQLRQRDNLETVAGELYLPDASRPALGQGEQVGQA